MTDIFTPSKRSFVMSKIHSKETKPEPLCVFAEKIRFAVLLAFIIMSA
ncbi:TPA: virulence factor TspB C-terminal domain-related protein, partial [Neisseria gonorrhoeae]